MPTGQGTDMTEQAAKQQLTRMLRSLTPGSVLHLFAEIHREAAAEAIRAGDLGSQERCRLVEAALFVTGFGIDAALPR